LSGAAVICDGRKAAIGYSGGGYRGDDDSFFGSYAYQTSFVLTMIRDKASSIETETTP
jgi:hypothetical protein